LATGFDAADFVTTLATVFAGAFFAATATAGAGAVLGAAFLVTTGFAAAGFGWAFFATGFDVVTDFAADFGALFFAGISNLPGNGGVVERQENNTISRTESAIAASLGAIRECQESSNRNLS
jgi:hypothetical protein